jgi:rubrerythrin
MLGNFFVPPIDSASTERHGIMGGLSRRALLMGSAAGMGAFAGGAVGATDLAASPTPHRSATTDTAILAFALLMERLQASFYAEALRTAHLKGEARQFAQVVGEEERAHVDFLEDALGSGAGTSPRFHFGDAVSDRATFIATAISLEETGLGVYNGQAVNLRPKTLAAAARIVSVEARHAAWARALVGKLPAPVPVDVAISVSQGKRTFEPFIVS